jgi:hypothetical protein
MLWVALQLEVIDGVAELFSLPAPEILKANLVSIELKNGCVSCFI